MKPITAIFVCSMLTPVMSALAQVQIGPQYRGLFVDNLAIHTGGIALESHFPQENWAWGLETEVTTGPDLRYWSTAMLNAGLLIDQIYLYGSVGVASVADSYVRDSGGLFGLGVNFPISRTLRADFEIDTGSGGGVASSASLRYQFLTSANRHNQSYSSYQSRGYSHSKLMPEFYFGGGIGRSDLDSEGFDDPIGFNLRGGWMFSPYLALEASYFNSGEADDNDGGRTWYLDGDAFQFGVRASTDVRLPWQAYARLGYAVWDFELDASNTGQGEYSIDGSDLYYGAGLAYTRDASRYFLEFQRLDLDVDGESSDVDTLSFGFEYRCCARSTSRFASAPLPQSRKETYRQVVYEESSAQSSDTVAKAVALESLDPVESDEESSAVEVFTYSPEEEVVVTAPAPVHPMKIAIQEGCNVVSVKVIDDSEVWDLFCPSTLKRITVTI